MGSADRGDAYICPCGHKDFIQYEQAMTGYQKMPSSIDPTPKLRGYKIHFFRCLKCGKVVSVRQLT